MVLVVYLAGVSQAIGNGVVLFLNRVRRLRFVLSLALMGAIYLIGALVTAAATLAHRQPRLRPRPRLPADLAVVALAQAPRLLGFLTLAPYFGEFFDRLLDVWVLTLVLFGLHHGVGMPVQVAALLALLGWAAMRVLAFVFGRPLTYVVTALRHAAAGGPLTLDSRNLVDSLRPRPAPSTTGATASDDRPRPSRRPGRRLRPRPVARARPDGVARLVRRLARPRARGRAAPRPPPPTRRAASRMLRRLPLRHRLDLGRRAPAGESAFLDRLQAALPDARIVRDVFP